MFGMFALGALVVGLAQTAAPADHTQSFVAARAASPPPAQAAIDPAVWKDALKIPLLENFMTRTPAAHATTAYLMYDDKYLYLAVQAEQHGIPITAQQKVDHAGIAADDHITLELETSGNGTRVYTFRSSPTGVHDEASTENNRYAPDWRSYAHVDADGNYTVLLVVPLSAMHLQNGPQHWRANVGRYVAATGDLYVWAFEANATDPTSPQFWPLLNGITVTSKGGGAKPHAEVYALGSAGADHNRFQQGIGRFGQMKARSLGVDFTYPISGTLNVVGTLNPDFSNVEKDQTSVAPQQFARNYTEYRPFFAQGARYINALPAITMNGITESLFYTPSIGVFDRGVKVEGTSGSTAIGALNVAGTGFNDTALGYSYGNSAQTLRLSAEGVFAQHDGVKDGAYGAGFNLTNAHSGVFSIGKAQLENNTVTGESHYLFASQGVNTAAWFAAIDYRDVSPNFNPVDGYTAFDDIRGPRFAFNYNGVAPKTSAIKTYSFGGIVDRFVDSAGAVKEYDANGSLYVLFNNQLSFTAGTGTSALRFDADPSAPLVPFNLRQIGIGYKDSTPSPIDVGYAWGPFGGAFLQQATFSTSQSFGPYSFTWEYDGTVERGDGLHDSQWLRRFSVARSFGRNGTLAMSLRGVNGAGGYAPQGTNLSLLFHQRFENSDEFFFEYGTPASRSTLHRVIAKYVFRVGGGSNT